MTATAAALFVVLSATLAPVWEGTAEVSDIPHFEDVASRVEAGGLPYRDVELEYPPAALAPIVVPAYASASARGYARAFGAGMVLSGVAAILAAAAALGRLGAGPGRTAAALALPALSPLLLGPLLLTRFDLLPAALAVGALAAVLAGRERLGAGVLGTAIAVKLWPVLLLPVFVAWSWRRGGRRRAIGTGSVALVVAALLVLVPWALLAPAELAESIWRQLSRPLQIESAGASVLLGLHHAAGLPLDWESSHGSQNLTGAVSLAAAGITSLAQVAVLAWLWAGLARGPAEPERLVRYAAATVVAFVALGKVLSPQFLVWLLPLVPLVAGRRGVAASALLAVACLLTRGWFPGDYWELVEEFDPTASSLVLARNVTLLALLTVLAWPTRAREHAAARSRSPVPSPGRS